MKKIASLFWKWYEKNETLNTGIASGLFTLQLVHLYWLTTAVVLLKLFGRSFFTPSPQFEFIITLVDYTEIPAIIATSVLYINELRKKINYKSLLYLLFINSQWLHIMWITDEYVLEHFTNQTTISMFPVWLSWIAIFIDYLELPVIVDTLRRFFILVRRGKLKLALEELKED